MPRPNRWSVVFILAVTVPFAAAFQFFATRTLEKKMGDFEVFCTAAWAAATGKDLYAVADSHGWSYHYPPTLAILMRPFALAPEGKPPAPGALPYDTSFAVCYALNALLFLLAAALAARAIEAGAAREKGMGATGGGGGAALAGPCADGLFADGWQGRWQARWLLRCWPAGAMLIFALVTLGKGQVECLLAALVALFLWGTATRRPVVSGLALSLAVAVKLYPLPLIVFPAARRDWKTFLAFAGGLALWLVALPLAAWGWEPTAALYGELWTERLAGILGNAPDARVAAELSFLSSDMTSISAMLGRLALYGEKPGAVPLPAWAAAAQHACGAALVAALLWLGRGRWWNWRGAQPAPGAALNLAAATLAAALPLFVPTAELQYWLLALPLFAALLADAWRRRGRAWLPLGLLFWGLAAAAAVHCTENQVWRPLTILGPTTPLFALLTLGGLWALGRAPRAAKD